MKLIPTTETEIKFVIKTLKAKNSTGYDGISSRIFKNCMDVISRPQSHIIIESFAQSIYPERLKYPLVRPIYKMGERSDISNCRPISLLMTFSEIFERVMCVRLCQHLQVNNIIVPELYGFRKDRNMEMVIYTVTDYILKIMDEHRQIFGMFCDLTKAFDCVILDILLDKLVVYGK
jgi:hypothetical protein